MYVRCQHKVVPVQLGVDCTVQSIESVEIKKRKYCYGGWVESRGIMERTRPGGTLGIAEPG